MVLLVGAMRPLAGAAGQMPSRIYVSAYPCNTDQSGSAAEYPGTPVVTLYDRIHYGDAGYDGFSPRVAIENSAKGRSVFHFDVPPGNYDAFIKFSNLPRMIGNNGPLVVIPGHDRHLLVAGCDVVDWHSVGAIAGKLPITDISVSVLLFDRPVRCGDDFRAVDQKTLKLMPQRQRTQAVVDDGGYYANFHGYGKQDHTVALLFSGALFTEGAVLVTNAPDTVAGKPPFIIKDVTPEIIEVATRAESKLVCISGF